MRYLICVDDTDMPGTRGTGWLVQKLCEQMEMLSWGSCSPISRHQLFVHEDVPFTSHNSAMCFEMTIKEKSMESLIAFMADYLETRSQPGSDPGLCVARSDDIRNVKSLIEFGRMAKKSITSKPEAYDIARNTGIHLSEHGGTGDGVIGAVAGIGLRLSGDDGRYRGWHRLGKPGSVVSVDSLCSHPCIDRLVTSSGAVLSQGLSVRIGSEQTKTIRMGHRQVVVAFENEDRVKTGIKYRTLTRQEAKHF